MNLAERINLRLQEADYSQLVGKDVTYIQIRQMANSILKPFGGRAKLLRDKTLTPSQKRFGVAISGYYDVEKRDVVVQIHLPPRAHRLKMTPKKADRIQFLILQTLQHELIHKAQYSYDPDGDAVLVPFNLPSRAKEDRKKEMLYLSQRYEIEAYANSLAHEILYYYPHLSPSTVINRLNSCRRLSVYRTYKRAFKGTKWHRIKKELLRQTWRWIPEIVLPKRVLTNAHQ